MRFILSIVLITLIIHCASSRTIAEQDKRSGQGSACNAETAAVVTPGRPITIDEVDQSVSAQIQSLKEKMYALRRSALENLVSRVVLESEARAAGLSLEEYKRKLTSAVITVPDRQIEEVLLDNQAALSTLGADEAREKVRLDLESQMRLAAFRERVAELRSRAQVLNCLEEPMPPPVTISDRGPSLGPSDARVTIYEFSDFQCPYCRQAYATIKNVLAVYEGKVRLVFKHLPLPIHPQAFVAAQAAYCAHQQGRFWPFHDRLFSEDDLSQERLREIGAREGLDREQFLSCLGSQQSKAEVLKDVQEARRAGFTGTPTFVINRRTIRGAPSLIEFKRIVDVELGKRKEE